MKIVWIFFHARVISSHLLKDSSAFLFPYFWVTNSFEVFSSTLKTYPTFSPFFLVVKCNEKLKQTHEQINPNESISVRFSKWLIAVKASLSDSRKVKRWPLNKHLKLSRDFSLFDLSENKWPLFGHQVWLMDEATDSVSRSCHVLTLLFVTRWTHKSVLNVTTHCKHDLNSLLVFSG